MTEQEAINKLCAVPYVDPEKAHIDADWVLLNFLEANGFKALADTFKQVKEEVGFWYA